MPSDEEIRLREVRVARGEHFELREGGRARGGVLGRHAERDAAASLVPSLAAVARASRRLTEHRDLGEPLARSVLGHDDRLQRVAAPIHHAQALVRMPADDAQGRRRATLPARGPKLGTPKPPPRST